MSCQIKDTARAKDGYMSLMGSARQEEDE